MYHMSALRLNKDISSRYYFKVIIMQDVENQNVIFAVGNLYALLSLF